jgi:putative ABC transport system permease protein
MGHLHKVGFRLQPLFIRRRIEADLEDEIQAHLEMLTAENERAGMAPEEARCAAQREFGGVDQIKEQFRDERGYAWLDRIRLDLRFAGRGLLRSPAFAAVALATLALGIGTGAAILSFIHAALVRPLAYPDPDRLVQIQAVSPEGTRFPFVSGPVFEEWCHRSASFDGLAIVHPWSLNLIGDGHAVLVDGAEVSADYLRVLGIAPLLGRDFDAGDERTGSRHPVVLLAYEWWQSRFAGDPSIVGRTINLSQVPRTVIGVLSPHALVQDPVSFLVPISLEGDSWRTSVDSLWAPVIGRLKPGIGIGAAHRELAGITRRFYGGLPQPAVAYGAELVPLQRHLTEGSRPALLTLLAAVGLLLAIVGANLANLLLARAGQREKEMAVRAALGASVSRIASQVVAESLLLALFAALPGIAVAWLAIDALNRMTEGILPTALRPAMDARVVGLCLVLAAASGILIGWLPALHACRSEGVRALKDVGRGLTPGRRAASQPAFVVAQVALAMTLLIDGGLLLRSFANIVSENPGFNPHHTLGCDLALTVPRFSSWMSAVRFEHDVASRLAAIPGVEAVGTSGALPLRGPRGGPEGMVHGSVRVALAEHREHSDEIEAGLDLVAGDYFGAMGIRLLEGRVLTDADNRLNAPPVVVINDRLAGLLAPGRSAIGLNLRSAEGIGGEVVGVVASVRDRQLDAQPDPRIYGSQVINPWDCSVVLRSTLPPALLADRVRTEIGAVLPDQSVTNFRTLDEDVSRSLQQRSLTLEFLGVFALVGLGLACLGIYGVVAQAIGRRRRELCIRVALGAQDSDVVGLVWWDGLRLGLIGVAIGLAGAALGAWLITGRLYGVRPIDPLVFLSVTGLVSAAIAAFVCLPARRAARLNPALVLRSE